MCGSATACKLGDLVNRPPDTVALDCLVTELEPDVSVNGSLDAESCPAPQAPERFANLYRVAGGQHDSVSITVLASEFAPRLVVVDSLNFERPPVAETTQCQRLEGAACVRHFVLTHDGGLGLMVSSAGEGETGTYALTVTRPRAPRAPAALEQFGPDGTTPVPAGGELGASAIVLSAAVSDPDTLEYARLEVELRRMHEPFSQQATATGSLGAPGGPTVRVTGLESATAYHWQARTVDETGRASAWTRFGTTDGFADFRTAEAVTRLAFRVQPRTTQAGQHMSPAIEVAALDESGNVVTSFTGTVTLSIAAGTGTSGATIEGGNPSVAAENGVAVFPAVMIGRAGSGYRFEAVASGLAAAPSDAFDIVPGPAVRLAFTVQPSHTPANQTITPAVRVTLFDAFDNVATGFQGSVTVVLARNPLGVGTLSGTRTQPVDGGTAIFGDLSIDTPAQGYTLEASNNVGSIESASFNITVF